MSDEKPVDDGFSIRVLESGIEYTDLDHAPDEPLLIQVMGIRPDDLYKISQKFEIDLEDLQDLHLLSQLTSLVIRAHLCSTPP